MSTPDEVLRAAGSLSMATAIFVAAGSAAFRAPAKTPALRPLLKRNPKRAWGLFAARLASCRSDAPEAGVLALAVRTMRAVHGAFVFTSSIDGMFQRAAFAADRIVECHGALEWLQCTKRGCGEPTPGGLLDVSLDAKGNAVEPLPSCPRCNALLRPNVLFDEGDKEWEASRAQEQEDRLNDWLAELRAAPARKLVVVECAASQDPDVRTRAERVALALGGTLVRIDPRDARVARAGDVGVQMEVAEALLAIDAGGLRFRPPGDGA